MAPRTGEQFEKMRENSRHNIMAVALKLFATKGYHTTSVDAIARKARISKGLIYNYFKSKDKLLEEIVVGSMDTMVERFAHLLDEKDSARQMREFVSGMIDEAKEHMQFWRFYWSLISQPSIPKPIRNKIKHSLKGIVGLFSAVFKQHGSSNPEADAWLFASAMDGIILYYAYVEGECPIDAIGAMILERFGISGTRTRKKSERKP
jgi:AcrR family transcriptional regulator